MIKYYRNTFLAVKVSYCNELAQFCRLKGIEYNRVRQIAAMDKRIGDSHTQVPGPDGLKGFGGKCFPKDSKSLLYEMRKEGMKAPILAGALQRNKVAQRSIQTSQVAESSVPLVRVRSFHVCVYINIYVHEYVHEPDMDMLEWGGNTPTGFEFPA